jgi:uncharacterized protein YecT (DUF1311 family)
MRIWAERRLAGSVLVAVLILATAGAAGAEDQLDCRDWGNKDLNQHEMNMCAHRDYKAADAQLNAAYRVLTAKIDANAKTLLVEAQRAWIQFRDKECKYEAAENEGGSIYPMIYSGCLTRLTMARTRELKELAEQY